MENPVSFGALLQQAGVVFQETTGCSAIFSAPLVIKETHRSRTLRCAVQSGHPGISSVILKQIKEEPARGFSDWASAAFISRLPGTCGIVPRFHGGDVAGRFYLMEDFGPGRTLEDILKGDDPGAAHAALTSLASQMARLHAVTLGKRELFEGIRKALPETTETGCGWEARRWLDNREKILAWFQALDCPPPPGLDEGMEYISRIYSQPAGFLAFTHGDPAPSNNHFRNGKTRLLDFEYGDFRHALYDITAWNILCPLPLDCVREMRRCFRETLAESCSAAADEARFAEEWAVLCAYRALAMLTWISPEIIGRNRVWAGTWTAREAVYVAMSRLKLATASSGKLEAINKAAGVLAESMRNCWPGFGDAETLLPAWPVLNIQKNT